MDRSWISAHIYYHDSLDGLIAGAARPLIDELRARRRIDRQFFVRYWQGGPHLRLRLLPTAGDEQDVAAAVDDALAAYLRAHPSRAVVTEAGYLQVARPLAAVEPGQRAVEPLEPNNTVRWRAYEPEVARYGGTLEAMAAVEQQFTASSDVAVEVLAAEAGRDQRTGHALAAMFVAAAVCDGPRTMAAFCAAGHAEWGARQMSGVARPGAELEQRYQRQRSRLRDLAAHLTGLVERGAPGATPIARWMHSVSELVARLRGLEHAGRLDAGLGEVVRRCCHMHCNRLGIALPEETYLRYLLWQIAADREGAGQRLAQGAP